MSSLTTRERATRWHLERIETLRERVESGPRGERPVAKVELERRTWVDRAVGRLLEEQDLPERADLFEWVWCPYCRAGTWPVVRTCEGLVFAQCMDCGCPVGGDRHPDQAVRRGLVSPSAAKVRDEAKAAADADYRERKRNGQLTREEVVAAQNRSKAAQARINENERRLARGLYPAPTDPALGYDAGELAHYGRQLPFHRAEWL